MSPLAQILCFCFAVVGAPQPQMSREAGDIRYTYAGQVVFQCLR